MNPREIEVQIEELVLHGFRPSDQYPIADAMQAELGRLLTEQSLSVTNDVALEQLNADAIRLDPRATSCPSGHGLSIFCNIRTGPVAQSHR